MSNALEDYLPFMKKVTKVLKILMNRKDGKKTNLTGPRINPQKSSRGSMKSPKEEKNKIKKISLIKKSNKKLKEEEKHTMKIGKNLFIIEYRR
jgi:hypothetical protein